MLCFGQEAVTAQIVYLGSHAAGIELALVKGKMLLRIFGGITLCAGEFVEAVVGLRIHYVVLNLYYLAVGSAHEGGGLVAVAEVGGALAGFCFYVIGAVNSFRVHGYECGKAIATMDVEHLGYRAETVGGIDVAAVFHVILHAPTQFFGVGSVGVRPVVAPEVVKVVDVGTFGAEHFAEHSMLGHVKGVELIPVVAAILEYHAVLACFFAQFDELPALFEVHG